MFRFAQHDTRLILLIATQSPCGEGQGEGNNRAGFTPYPPLRGGLSQWERKIIRKRCWRTGYGKRS